MDLPTFRRSRCVRVPQVGVADDEHLRVLRGLQRPVFLRSVVYLYARWCRCVAGRSSRPFGLRLRSSGASRFFRRLTRCRRLLRSSFLHPVRHPVRQYVSERRKPVAVLRRCRGGWSTSALLASCSSCWPHEALVVDGSSLARATDPDLLHRVVQQSLLPVVVDTAPQSGRQVLVRHLFRLVHVAVVQLARLHLVDRELRVQMLSDDGADPLAEGFRRCADRRSQSSVRHRRVDVAGELLDPLGQRFGQFPPVVRVVLQLYLPV